MWHHWSKIFITLFITLFLISSVTFWQILTPVSSSNNLVEFKITVGQGAKTIAQNLAKAQFIRSEWWFLAWGWLTGADKHFVVGKFYLPKNINIIKLTKLLTKNAQPDNEISVRLIEGWTLQQMGDYVEQNKLSNADEFVKFVTLPSNFTVVLNKQSNVLASKPTSASLEGYLFPDTYRVLRNSSVADLVTRMLNNFEQKFLPVWQLELAQRGISVHEAVTLASIVEREAKTALDRAIVADIFWRRIKAGRGLEADSTINYVTGKNLPSVTYEDLKINSLYNTYKYRGLPPGPISNPGLISIKAVVYPQANDYWYFLTTPDGKMVYSKTYQEHINAKQKYLR